MAIVILLAGLPGVGKSRLACDLAPRLGAEVVDRDAIKGAIFPERLLRHSPAQVAVAADVALLVAATVIEEHPSVRLVIDGHTFSRRADVARWRRAMADVDAHLVLVACEADPGVVRERILGDEEGLDKQRDWQKHLAVASRAEHLEHPDVTVDLTVGTRDAVDAIVRVVDAHGVEQPETREAP